GGQHGIGECVSAAARDRSRGHPGSSPHASGKHASGAVADGSAGPRAYPSPSDPTGPPVIWGISPEQPATPEAPASSPRTPGHAANQSEGQSKSPDRSKSPDQSRSLAAGGQADNRGSGKPKGG